MKKKVNICHLTSVHRRFDIRIFVKECSSLAKVKGFDVSLIVADGIGNECKNNINIYDVGKPSSRLNRIFKIDKKVYKKALELNRDIYHIHDPELIPYGLKLKRKGKKVIFDAHEDFPMQILSKHYVPNFAKTLVSKLFIKYEKKISKKLDGIITATPFIKNKFKSYASNVMDIRNYPLNDEIKYGDVNFLKKDNSICYVGGISQARGVYELVESLGYLNNTTLELAGAFVDEKYERKIRESKNWDKVNFHGFVDRTRIIEIFNKSSIGMVTLYKTPNIINSLPIKLFEYMSAGLPVIVSNIPYWEDIVVGKCGLSVNPKSSKEVAEAITYLFNNPKEAKRMGEQGKKDVINKYNWEIEEKKLIDFYHKL